MNAVWRYSKAQGRARLVLLAIADMHGEIGAWPAIKTLADMVNASERSVKRDIKELEELGELVVEAQAAPVDSQYRPNRYWITLSGVTDRASGVTESTSGVTDQVSRGDRLGKSGVTTLGTQTLNRTLKNQNTFIPGDYRPNEKDLATMREHFPDIDLKLETYAMIDYFTSTGKMKKDWDATWRNWIRNAHKKSVTSPSMKKKLEDERRQREIEELYATEGD